VISVLKKAVELMSLVPKQCNDMMNLGRLQGYEVNSPLTENRNTSFIVTVIIIITSAKVNYMWMTGRSNKCFKFRLTVIIAQISMMHLIVLL